VDAYRAAPAGTRISGVVRWSLVGEKGWSLVSEKQQFHVFLYRRDNEDDDWVSYSLFARNHAPTLELDNSHTPCRLTQSCV